MDGNVRFDFKGMTALITGATGGIGSVIASRFAEAGSDVVLCYRTNAAAAQDLLNDITEKYGVSAMTIQLEVTSPESCKNCVSAALEKFEKIDFLINSAGIPNKQDFIEKIDFEEVDKNLRTNLLGPIMMAQEVLPGMKIRKSGSVITLSSVAGQSGSVGALPYSTSKAGLEGYNRTLALEAAPYGITANIVSMGIFDVGMINTVPEKFLNRLKRQVPLGRVGTAEEVTSLVMFLCSREASYITGQTISINGGLHFNN
ncbi:MAG: SDR family oxidoreductase [Firmicutes bacterium]|nr:SDR family oxidoreductase [Bacillota bacterium]